MTKIYIAFEKETYTNAYGLMAALNAHWGIDKTIYCVN